MVELRKYLIDQEMNGFRRYRKMFGYWFSPSSEELWDGGQQLLKVDFTQVVQIGYFY